MSEKPRDCEHGHLARSCLICELTQELADMTARAEIAERQVALLCGRIDCCGSCLGCPAINPACSHSSKQCRDALAAWSRAKAIAERGGNDGK